jgi:hypothetical protein
MAGGLLLSGQRHLAQVERLVQDLGVAIIYYAPDRDSHSRPSVP